MLVKYTSIAVVALGLSACVETSADSQFGSRKLAEGLQGGFLADETLEVDASRTLVRRGRFAETGDFYIYTPQRYDIEINPVEVAYDPKRVLDPKRPDWVAGCSKDEMTDRTKCRMNILPQGPGGNSGGLFQTVDLQGNIRSSCILGHDFPGRRGMIRVDRNAAITTDTDGCIYGGTARRLQSQLASGSRLITRRVEWPYDNSKDEEMLVGGGYRSARAVYQFSANADLVELFNVLQ